MEIKLLVYISTAISIGTFIVFLFIHYRIWRSIQHGDQKDLRFRARQIIRTIDDHFERYPSTNDNRLHYPEPGIKFYSCTHLMRARDRVLNSINNAGFSNRDYADLLHRMKLTHARIPHRRVGNNYNDLFAKLHEFAAQFLGQVAKRPDLEAAFRANQPVYDDEGADTTYFSLLLDIIKSERTSHTQNA